MWQKARILKQDHHPEVTGFTVWVKAHAPEMVATRCSESRLSLGVNLRACTNIRRDNGVGRIGNVRIAPELIELLPEFAEDVPLISWDEFLRGES